MLHPETWSTIYQGERSGNLALDQIGENAASFDELIVGAGFDGSARIDDNDSVGSSDC